MDVAQTHLPIVCVCVSGGGGGGGGTTGHWMLKLANTVGSQLFAGTLVHHSVLLCNLIDIYFANSRQLIILMKIS